MKIIAYPWMALLPVCLLSPHPAAAPAPDLAEIVEVRRIWDAAPHNAFTDLIRFEDEWFCVFREGEGHVSPDGALRVLVSRDGATWTAAARLTHPEADLRDPKITRTPDGQLQLSGAAAWNPPSEARHQTFTWFSTNGRDWSEPVAVGEPDVWLWRITWHQDAAYGIGYGTGGDRFTRLYRSEDGRRFEPWVPRLFEEGYPNETSLVFQPDGTALCLLRRDGEPNTAQLGRAGPPFTGWTWQDLGVRLGGPHLLRLPDGRHVAAARLYEDGVRTALAWIDPKTGTLNEFLTLPSGGDTSYAGLVWHDDLLWVSYYSSHEGRSSIYLAQVRLPPGRAPER